MSKVSKLNLKALGMTLMLGIFVLIAIGMLIPAVTISTFAATSTTSTPTTTSAPATTVAPTTTPPPSGTLPAITKRGDINRDGLQNRDDAILMEQVLASIPKHYATYSDLYNKTITIRGISTKVVRNSTEWYLLRDMDTTGLRKDGTTSTYIYTFDAGDVTAAYFESFLGGKKCYKPVDGDQTFGSTLDPLGYHYPPKGSTMCP